MSDDVAHPAMVDSLHRCCKCGSTIATTLRAHDGTVWEVQPIEICPGCQNIALRAHCRESSDVEVPEHKDVGRRLTHGLRLPEPGECYGNNRFVVQVKRDVMPSDSSPAPKCLARMSLRDGPIVEFSEAASVARPTSRVVAPADAPENMRLYCLFEPSLRTLRMVGQKRQQELLGSSQRV
jgi:hypothetical protein